MSQGSAGPLVYVLLCALLGGAAIAHGLGGIDLYQLGAGWILMTGDEQPARGWVLAAGTVLVGASAFYATRSLGAPGLDPFPDLRPGPTVLVSSPEDRWLILTLLAAPVFAWSLVSMGLDFAVSMDDFLPVRRGFLLTGPFLLYGLYQLHVGGRHGPTALVLERPQFELGERLLATLRRDPRAEPVEHLSLRLVATELVSRKTRTGGMKTETTSTSSHEIWSAEEKISFPPGAREVRVDIPLPPVLPPGSSARRWDLELHGEERAKGYHVTFGGLPVAVRDASTEGDGSEAHPQRTRSNP
jgi:hypothetical protein